MSTNPEQIRQQIEHTRSSLSNDGNALAAEATPKNIAQRTADKAMTGVRQTATNLKERVMGTEEQAAHALSDTAGNARQMAQRAPQQMRRRTRGNPLAAGLAAFGLGALIGGLIPSSEPERRAAETVKDKAGPVVDEAKQMARDAAEQVKPAVQQAGDDVKQAAVDAKDEVVGQAKTAKDNVTSQGETPGDGQFFGTHDSAHM